MDVVVDIESGSNNLIDIQWHCMVARMDSLQDEVSKLTSEKRKRKRKDDCLNLEKELEQELLSLRGKRRSKAAPSSSGSGSKSRAYTHDTSVRKGGTTRPKPRVHRKKNTPDVLETPSDTCELSSETTFVYDPDDSTGHTESVESETDVQQKLDDLLHSIETSLVEKQHVTSWQKRMELREESWETFRGQLFEEVVMYSTMPIDSVCYMCGDENPRIRCHQCGASQYMCHLCDQLLHKHQPLHDREIWCDGIFKAVSPTTVCVSSNFDTEALSSQRLSIPFSLPWRCPLCSKGKIDIAPRESTRIVVNLRGRYDLNDVQPICESCGERIHLQSPHDIIREQYCLLKKNNPGVSETGFLKTLEQISLAKGRVGSLNTATFSKAFNEWRYCQYSLRKLKHSPMFECPCCTPIQHSVHFDGNKKLYRYSKVPRGLNKQYYEEFIVPNEEVDRHLDLTGYFGETTNEVGLCGTTRWKAAKAVSKSMTNLDETGLEVAGCRHALALKALNMFRGEIFGYPHYLHTKIFPGVNCVWADVICLYWPWALSKASKLPELEGAMSAQPCLSVMHAKAHSWHCQILWGGRWQNGAANGAGEEMEQLFSYLSRFNLTTKYMSAAGREEQLVEAAMFWNIRKIYNLPKYLKARLKKTRCDLERLQKDLLLLQGAVGKDLTPEYCKQCCCDIQDIAKRESTASESTIEQQKVEYFELKRTIDTALMLQPLLNSTSAAMSILTGNEQLYSEAERVALFLDSTKKRQLEELRRGIVTSSTDLSSMELDRACESAAVKAAVHKLQEQIELVYLTAQRRHANIQQISTTSKQRTKLRKAISVDHKKLQKLTSQYNDLIGNYSLDLPYAVVEEIIAGQFPWSSLSNRHCVSVQEKYKISTLYNQLQRLKEEETLLLQEMTQYLSYFKTTLPEKLQADIEDITKELRQSAEAPSGATSTEDLQSADVIINATESDGTCTSTLTKKYYALLNPKRTPILEGLLAVKRGGLHEAIKLLKMAAQEFKSEHISSGEEEIDCSYLLNRELDFDEDDPDINDDIDIGV